MSDRVERSRGGSVSNAIANWINFFVSAAIGLVVNPLLLRFLGTDAFGVWKGTQRVLDLAGVVDGRSAQALKWVVAHRHAGATVSEKRRDVGAGMVFGLLMAPVLIAACAAMVLLLPVLIQDVPENYLAAMYWAGAFLAANVILRGLLMVPDAVLVGTNQGHRSMNVTTVFLVLSNVAMIGAAFAGWGIGSFGAIVLLSAIGNAAVTWWIARKRVPWWGLEVPTKDDIRRVGGFSAWSMGWRVVNQSLATIDGVLIGALIGASAITQFTFTSYVVTFAYAIAQATTSALMPGLGHAIGAGAENDARARVRQVGYVNLLIVTIAGSLILALNGEFVRVWAGPGMYMGDLFNVVLVLSFLQVSLTRNSSQIQDAALHIRRRVILGLVCTVVSILLGIAAYLLVQQPYAILLGLIVGRLPMVIVYRMDVGRLLPRASVSAGRLIAAAVLLAIAAVVGLSVPNMVIWIWIPYAVGLALAIMAASWYLVLSSDMRTTLRKVVVGRLRRRKP